MTPFDFKLWRSILTMSQQDAADALGISKGTVQNYERGKTSDGRPQPIPRTVALACAAIYGRVTPWTEARANEHLATYGKPA